jgi:1-acyl-sn-glycerol-3-phosphate acyltransferase
MLDQGKETPVVRMLRGTLLLVMKLLFRIEHRGWERIPPNGPLLFISNHVTYCDPFWIAVRVYRTLRFMAWDKIFSLPQTGRLFRWLGAFPVSLENPEFSAYKAALTVLRKGEALMIFPEGGRSPDGKLLPFKEGAARLALRSGATIVPVVIFGGEKVWSSRMILPRPAKIRVEYLEPISRDQFPPDAASLIEKVRQQILERQSKNPATQINLRNS